MWDVAVNMNSSIDSTNVLVANFKPLYWARLATFANYAMLTRPKKAETAVQGR